MNTFATNATGFQSVAQQTIADRVADAERRAVVRALRAERRAARKSARRQYDPPLTSLPYWTFRFLRPAH